MRAGKPAQVTIRNQGNVEENYTLTWQDRADELVFEPPGARLTVPEGRSGSAEFRAAPRQWRLIGGQKVHNSVIQVGGSRGEPQVHTGEVVSKGLIPA